MAVHVKGAVLVIHDQIMAVHVERSCAVLPQAGASLDEHLLGICRRDAADGCQVCQRHPFQSLHHQHPAWSSLDLKGALCG